MSSSCDPWWCNCKRHSSELSRGIGGGGGGEEIPVKVSLVVSTHNTKTKSMGDFIKQNAVVFIYFCPIDKHVLRGSVPLKQLSRFQSASVEFKTISTVEPLTVRAVHPSSPLIERICLPSSSENRMFFLLCVCFLLCVFFVVCVFCCCFCVLF